MTELLFEQIIMSFIFSVTICAILPFGIISLEKFLEAGLDGGFSVGSFCLLLFSTIIILFLGFLIFMVWYSPVLK